MPPRFDLQSHSTHSDGALPAAEVVQRAAEAGVELLALSDHDTVGGVTEALEAGERLGVRVIPAVEISAVDEDSPVPRELHILGYNIRHTDPVFTERLAEFLADREQRTLRMAAALGELGFELDHREIDDRVGEGQPIGRPHLAEAVLAAPANAARLEEEDIDDIGSLI
ncbi:MAG TPA: PHP domain-containing protein, partial [Solirubrobacteraceae bacterium]|nr:PHP domain-containing protein [Solirubrobacteraceae bacterium]